MAAAGLRQLARVDDSGRARFRILQNPRGELVLAEPDVDPPQELRPLDGLDCMRLAAATLDRPGMVVESTTGEYVVVVDGPPDPASHLPLALDDAEVLAGPFPATARFGRRDDDVLELTPWAPDQQLPVLDPEADEFRDVPLVALVDGEVVVERGELDEALRPAVAERLAASAAADDTRFGVFTNVFGEVSLVEVGAPVEPHADVRRQTVIRTSGLLHGAATLGEAAARLRAFAGRLEAAEAQGWRLPQPIAGDHGFPERDAQDAPSASGAPGSPAS
ncbi:MAG TPA: hypothetical protein VIK95_13295 [Egibacteraceae bacterium]